MLTLAAAEAGVGVMDSAYTDIANPAGFEAEAQDARALSFKGQELHPPLADLSRKPHLPAHRKRKWPRHAPSSRLSTRARQKHPRNTGQTASSSTAQSSTTRGEYWRKTTPTNNTMRPPRCESTETMDSQRQQLINSEKKKNHKPTKPEKATWAKRTERTRTKTFLSAHGFWHSPCGDRYRLSALHGGQRGIRDERYPSSCGEIGWPAVDRIAALLDAARPVRRSHFPHPFRLRPRCERHRRVWTQARLPGSARLVSRWTPGAELFPEVRPRAGRHRLHQEEAKRLLRHTVARLSRRAAHRHRHCRRRCDQQLRACHRLRCVFLQLSHPCTAVCRLRSSSCLSCDQPFRHGPAIRRRLHHRQRHLAVPRKPQKSERRENARKGDFLRRPLPLLVLVSVSVAAPGYTAHWSTLSAHRKFRASRKRELEWCSYRCRNDQRKGGVSGKKVELVTGDASTPDKAQSEAERLSSLENLQIITGTYSSGLSYAASQVVERRGGIYWETGGHRRRSHQARLQKLLPSRFHRHLAEGQLAATIARTSLRA